MDSKSSLEINVLAGIFTVCRLATDEDIPAWAEGAGFLSVTRTAEELSIVCELASVPEGVRCEPGWRVLQIQGPLEFGLVGVLAAVAVPLAGAGVSIFAISTFDTDYILVKSSDLARSTRTLRAAGHTINQP
jgi:hypothetical protein